jgi:hypothetical protein
MITTKVHKHKRKNKKTFTNKQLNLYMDCYSSFMQFKCYLIFHQRPSKLYNNFNDLI